MGLWREFKEAVLDEPRGNDYMDELVRSERREAREEKAMWRREQRLAAYEAEARVMDGIRIWENSQEWGPKEGPIH